jgi:error-prone DNA polymerase
VIQHVYDKYGPRGAGMTANVITYRERSASREIGKVLGITEGEIDRLSRHLRRFEYVDPKDTLDKSLADARFDKDDKRVRVFARLFREIQDLPRHLGQHSGGMVIAQGELDAVVPLEPASMPGRVVVQWDKDDCADLGIVKVDLLGLGMMSALQGLAHAAAPDRRGRGPGPPAAGRPQGLRHAPVGRHRGPVPGREPRAVWPRCRA